MSILLTEQIIYNAAHYDRRELSHIIMHITQRNKNNAEHNDDVL